METSFLRELRLKRQNVPDFNQYPYHIPAIRDLDTLPLHPAVTYFVGENGSGKSTLIEAIAMLAGFNAKGGSKNFNYTYHASESDLYQHLTLTRNFRREKTGFFLRAETMFNLFTKVVEQNLSQYGWEDMHTKSHGESFLWLMENRFGNNGLFILDEPEAALSPQRQLAFLRLIHERVQQGCQFIIATHSPILMAYPEATLYWLDDAGISPRPFQETEHFTLTQTFCTNPDQMLHYLLQP